jgi:hypothetical protein
MAPERATRTPELRCSNSTCQLIRLISLTEAKSKSKLLYDWQSVWLGIEYPCGTCDHIISCRNVAVWNLRSCICWAPSLTRGRVYNLHCNHSIVQVAQNPKPYFTVSSETPPTWRSEVWGHVTTNSQSVSMSWHRAHLRTCDQILTLSEFRCVVFVGRHLWREVGSVSCQSLSAIIVHCQFLFCFCFFILHVIHFMYIQYTQGLVSPGSVQQIMLIICSLYYNSNLITWTVVRLTATKLKPLKFSMSRFALPYIADITIIIYIPQEQGGPVIPLDTGASSYSWYSWCLEADPSVDTARNNSCIVAIVDYHGNPVYRAATWIPTCAICGRIPWKAPTQALLWAVKGEFSSLPVYFKSN